MYRIGDLPVTITRPEWAAARGRFVACVIVGGNRHSAEGKTPERAARWLSVRLAGLWAYSDTCRVDSFKAAATARRRAMREALEAARGAKARAALCPGGEPCEGYDAQDGRRYCCFCGKRLQLKAAE